jgi:hypothetical protein
MKEATVGIYVYNDRAYLPTLARIRTGGWFDTEPVITCNLDAEKLVKAVEKILASDYVVLEPTDPEMGNPRRGAVLKATKTRSWKELAKKGTSYNIDFTPDRVRLDMSRLDKKGRWEFDPNKVQILPPDTNVETLVEIILRDVRTRPQSLQEG